MGRGHAAFGTNHRDRRSVEHLAAEVSVLPCDMQDREQVNAAVATARPDRIFHLAAQSLPSASWNDAETTITVNLLGTLHLLEAVRTAGLSPTIVLAGSSAEYGPAAADEPSINEARAPQPDTPYGVSKMAATLLAQVYARRYGMKIVCVRPFFVIGPRKIGDVCSDFARGIVAIERGESGALKVGDLRPVRDFVDVRDAVEALWLLSERGASGEVYNLSSGRGHAVGEVMETLIALSERSIPVEQDASRIRAIDAPAMVGDSAKLQALGWTPHLTLRESLIDILDYWRSAGRQKGIF